MNLLTQLNTLETTGLIRLAAVQPDLEYLFRHALVQDVADSYRPWFDMEPPIVDQGWVRLSGTRLS